MAALACYKTGEASRLIYRPCPDARPDGCKSFSWKDYRGLIQTAHQQLGGPIVLIWDNLNVHLTAGMRQFIAGRDWLTVYQLPPTHPTSTPSRASGPCCDAAGCPTPPSPHPST
ncbi:transposase [Streptomyces phyllanthi]|uniref:transposase n=1 Tax=Streptomyces phyllanthi TaxID=1803180 RepID=UPI003CD07D00